MAFIKNRYKSNNAIAEWGIDTADLPAAGLEFVNFVDVTITAAQMNTINATPITGVVAQGAGKYIFPHAVVTKINAGETPFEAGSGTLDYKVGSTVVAQVPNATLESASDAVYRSVGLVGALTANTALTITTSADVTAGDGTVDVRIYYSVIEI
jgi:hypothetical protein